MVPDGKPRIARIIKEFMRLAEGCRNRTYRRPTGLPPVLKFDRVSINE
jgi:hypothetical protein